MPRIYDFEMYIWNAWCRPKIKITLSIIHVAITVISVITAVHTKIWGGIKYMHINELYSGVKKS